MALTGGQTLEIVGAAHCKLSTLIMPLLQTIFNKGKHWLCDEIMVDSDLVSRRSRSAQFIRRFSRYVTTASKPQGKNEVMVIFLSLSIYQTLPLVYW